MSLNIGVLTDLAIMILAGMFFGRMLKHLHLPNVTGYLIAGLLIGPYFFRAFGLDFSILSEDFVNNIAVISDVALGFIAFSIGNEFKFSFFKRVGVTPIVIACLESLFAVVFTVIVLSIVTHQLPFSMVLGSIAAATAPAATIMVINQYRAKGQVTETLLAVVAIDDATALMLFSISTTIAKTLEGGGSSNIVLSILSPIGQILAALGIGFVLGLIELIPMKHFHKRGNRLSLVTAFIFAGIGIGELLGLSSLMVCMALGATIANISSEADEIMDIADSITAPIFVLFFVASGAGLQLKVLKTVGLIGVCYIVFRVVGKVFGTWLGGKICHADEMINKYLGPCLLPQAGVAIGLTLVAGKVVPDYAPQIRAVVLAGTLVYELIGPAVTKISLTKAGEIKNA